MKRLLAAFLAVFLLITFCACAHSPEGDVVETTDSAESLSSQIGFEMSAPATAKNAEYSIINHVIGQITFSYNSILFVYRGSKIYHGEQLYGLTVDVEKPSDTVEIGDRATVSIYYDKEGHTAVTWYIEGTYYSLTSVKGVNSDALTELCDLIIK